MTLRRFIDGPFDGETIEVRDDVSVVQVDGFDDMAYGRAKFGPPADPDWYMKGLPEPTVEREIVFEWHERGWENPEVRWLRGVLEDAMS